MIRGSMRLPPSTGACSSRTYWCLGNASGGVFVCLVGMGSATDSLVSLWFVCFCDVLELDSVVEERLLDTKEKEKAKEITLKFDEIQ